MQRLIWCGLRRHMWTSLQWLCLVLLTHYQMWRIQTCSLLFRCCRADSVPRQYSNPTLPAHPRTCPWSSHYGTSLQQIVGGVRGGRHNRERKAGPLLRCLRCISWRGWCSVLQCLWDPQVVLRWRCRWRWGMGSRWCDRHRNKERWDKNSWKGEKMNSVMLPFIALVRSTKQA